MKSRKLRIAWSVAWGVVAVLLCVLWVRSYWWFDSFSVCIDGSRAHWLGSIGGEIRYGRPLTSGVHGPQWYTYDTPTSAWLSSEPPHHSVLGFRWGEAFRGRRGYPIIPHWFVVFVVLTCAAAPWFHWHFRLRTLMIATTLVAVSLGLIVYASR